jgi:ribokinase
MAQPIITVVGSFAVGMTMRTSHMPVFGETLVGSDFDMGPGGKGSNQAVGTAKLGARSYFAGIIGDDKLGEIATELYAREGVDTTYMQKTREMATGVGFIIAQRCGHVGARAAGGSRSTGYEIGQETRRAHHTEPCPGDGVGR